jgi:eukaryotic-like serine/threonine-protein kinase
MSTSPDQSGSTQVECLCCQRRFDSNEALCLFDNTVLTPLKKAALVGSVIHDHYEILSPIGTGATSSIYRARHNLMLRTVALKILKQSLANDPKASNRLKREALALSLFEHHSIVGLYDCGKTSDNLPFLVIEYLEGVDLSKLIRRRGSIAINRAIPIFIQACEAFSHMHNRGVVHRDVKPENIIVRQSSYSSRRDTISIVDFGRSSAQRP